MEVVIVDPEKDPKEPWYRKSLLPGRPDLMDLIRQEDEEEGEWFVGECLPGRLGNHPNTAKLWWTLTDLGTMDRINGPTPTWLTVSPEEFEEWLRRLGFNRK